MSDTDNKCFRNSDKSNWSLKFRTNRKGFMKETGLERRVQFRQVHERGQLFRRNEFSISISIV